MTNELPLPSKYHCPACQREIYTRRRKTCEFCGEALPDALRLTADEAAEVDEEIKQMNERRERDRIKEEEWQRRTYGDGGSDGGVVGM